MSTQSQANVTLSKTGRDDGTWAGRTGGEVDRNVSDYYPGGMQPAKKLFAVPTTGDVTVRKLLADLTDDDVRALLADQNTDTVYSAVQQRLNAANSPKGASFAWKGNVKTVTLPEHDSSSSDAAEITVVLSIIGTPTSA
jgi:hypothetical protein